MSHLKNTGFADRISAQQEAKKAMLAKFKSRELTGFSIGGEHVEIDGKPVQ